MKTKAEIRQRVGEDLGIVPIGQEIEAQDQARIDATYTEVYEIVKEHGFASWASTGNIPDKLMPSFCLLMESKLLTSFSVPESRYVRINAEAGPDGMAALKTLTGLVQQEYESHNDVTDY